MLFQLVEAADAPLENLQAVDDLKKLNEQLVQTTAALNGLVVPTYKKVAHSLCKIGPKSLSFAKSFVLRSLQNEVVGRNCYKLSYFCDIP